MSLETENYGYLFSSNVQSHSISFCTEFKDFTIGTLSEFLRIAYMIVPVLVWTNRSSGMEEKYEIFYSKENRIWNLCRYVARMFLAIFNISLGVKHRIEILAYCFQITRTSLLIFIYVGVYDICRRWIV